MGGGGVSSTIADCLPSREAMAHRQCTERAAAASRKPRFIVLTAATVGLTKDAPFRLIALLASASAVRLVEWNVYWAALDDAAGRAAITALDKQVFTAEFAAIVGRRAILQKVSCKAGVRRANS